MIWERPGFRGAFVLKLKFNAPSKTRRSPKTWTVSTNRSSADCNLSMRDSILAIVPSLRSVRDLVVGQLVDRADDLVQETLLRALANIGSFELGTNLGAWLFTI